MSKSAKALAEKKSSSPELIAKFCPTPETPTATDFIEKHFPSRFEVECVYCAEINKVSFMLLQTEAVFCLKCHKELKHMAGRIENDTSLMITTLIRLGFHKNQTREIVTNAFSALEVWVRNIIREELASRKIDAELINFIFVNMKFFAKFSELLPVLKFERPAGIEARLETVQKLRNKVVHAGYVPTYSEAKNAVSVVLEMTTDTRKPAPSLSLLNLALGKSLSIRAAAGIAERIKASSPKK